MRKIRFLSFISALLLLISCSASQPKLERIPESGVVVAFGDSLTYGTGAAQSASYPAVLTELINRSVINAGVSGDTSAKAVERLPDVLEQYHPDLVIIEIGANDIRQRLPMNDLKDNLDKLIDQAKSTGAQVVLVAPPEIPFVVKVPKFYDELAQKYNLPIEREILSKLIEDPKYKSDSVHFNADGYREFAEAMAHLLHETGAV